MEMRPPITFVPVNLNGPQTVRIEARSGTISATPNGGALRARQGQPVTWECLEEFTLTFTQLGGSAQPWTVPPAARVGAMYVVKTEAPSFATATPPYYEYTIKIGDLTLDPILIVDK